MRPAMSRRLQVLIAGTLLFAACSSSAKTSAPTNASTTTALAATTTTVNSDIAVVQAYITAFDAGDAKAAAAEFATDAHFSTPLGSCNPCVGRAVIEQKLAPAIAANTKLAIAQTTASGNTVKGKSTLTSPKFPAAVKRAIGSFTATIANGKIMQLDQEYDRTDAQTDALFKSLGE